MAKWKTSEYAVKFDCHPKTILRAMLQDPAPSDWHDETFDATEVANVFELPSCAALERVMRGQDDLIDAGAAAKQMGISLRRFHQKQTNGSGPRKAANHGRIVRYLLSDIFDI